MSFRLTLTLFICSLAALAANHTAAHLAAEARQAQAAGQVVRAYLLFAEAAERDPHNASYAVARDALKPLANLLTESNIQSKPDISADIRAAEADNGEEPLPKLNAQQVADATANLQPVAHVVAQPGLQNFDIRADDRGILTQVARKFGVEAAFDPDFDTTQTRHFVVDQMDFATAMSAATAATGTFAFATGPKRIFIARDSETKRSEFEPETVITVDLPNAIDPRDVTDAVNAIRAVTGLRGTMAWSTTEHKVIIRDHVPQAEAAAAVLQELVLPKAQVAFEVQLMAVDSDVTYQYGINWQTSYQVLPLGLFTKLHNPSLPSLVNSTFLPFGGGASLLGIGLADASLFATFTSTASDILYHANLMVESGQTASLHVGDKYPVATALYSGFSQASSSAAAYNPIGQVTQEDLGLTLKVAPHVTSDGAVLLDLEAEYETLGNQGLDSVPSINQRAFKGTVTLQEGQWAVIGGMQEDDRSLTKQGLPGLGQIAGVDLLFAQTTREHRKSDTLLVIKPTITRLPMSTESLSAFLLGPRRGSRTIF